MPTSHARPPSARASALPRLLALTALVLLVHALLLGGMPSAARLMGRSPDAAPAAETVARFATRTISPEPAPQPTPTPAPPSPAAAQPTAARPKPQAPATALPLTETPDASTAPSAGTPATVAAAPAVAPASSASAALADAQGPHQPLPAPSTETAQAHTPAAAAPVHSQPVAYADSIRLLYDGKGEERGFIKYAAGAELLWLHDASQYSARLEISAWGFRVRTWTSKGALTDTGLAPIRFGDKPRGAELATHFQRDKGLITFSANNPDVPLQAGAQDKLSALLQLSALVAGAPEHYSAGNSIRFQAADAHNAELWDFKVGALELLDLPGGPKQALKLSKAPTLEFDQGIEVWLAPDLHYLPVRLRITEANGAYADLLWRKTQSSD